MRVTYQLGLYFLYFNSVERVLCTEGKSARQFVPGSRSLVPRECVG